MPINMVFPQCILSTFSFLKAKCFWFGWRPLRRWGFVQCMDTWPQEQFHGQQFTFSALDFACTVTRLLPTFDVNKPRKFGHPVLKQPLHVYKLRVAISSSRYYIIFPSGEAPRIPEGWNQIPVSFTVFPVRSVLTCHCTAFTLDKSYSPRRRFRSEGVSLFLPWGQNRSHPNKHGEVSFQVSARNDSRATKNMNVSTTLSR